MIRVPNPGPLCLCSSGPAATGCPTCARPSHVSCACSAPRRPCCRRPRRHDTCTVSVCNEHRPTEKTIRLRRFYLQVEEQIFLLKLESHQQSMLFQQLIFADSTSVQQRVGVSSTLSYSNVTHQMHLWGPRTYQKFTIL